MGEKCSYICCVCLEYSFGLTLKPSCPLVETHSLSVIKIGLSFWPKVNNCFSLVFTVVSNLVFTRFDPSHSTLITEKDGGPHLGIRWLLLAGLSTCPVPVPPFPKGPRAVGKLPLCSHTRAGSPPSPPPPPGLYINYALLTLSWLLCGQQLSCVLTGAPSIRISSLPPFWLIHLLPYPVLKRASLLWALISSSSHL